MAGYPGSGGYGAPPGGYGAPPGGYGAPPGGYGAPPGGYGAPPGGYGAPPGGYVAPPPGGYGAPPGGYGAPPPGGYGAPPGGYGAPPPGGYGAPPPGGYGAPPPGGYPQSGYGAPPGGYGAPPGGYGAPPGVYGAPPGGYGVPPGGSTTTVTNVSTPVGTVSSTTTTTSIPIVFMPIFTYPPSNPLEDARTLYKSMKGLGTDDSTLIHVMTHRSKQQLEQIAAVYNTEHKHTLEKDIRGDTSGHYCTLLLELAKPLIVLKADALRNAMKGIGTRERILIDVLAHSSNAEIRAIKSIYKDLERDIRGDTSGNFENVLISLCKADRQEITFIDDDHAKRVAAELYEAGERRWGTDDSTFVRVITSYSPYFLDRVSFHYERAHGHSLHRAIEKETSGYYKEALIACATPPDVHFANRLNQCMKGVGTDDRGLIYCFSVHDRAQLKHIASIYVRKFGSLIQDIKGDTSGNYCKTLCSLLE